jgi:hypothetical protein
MRSTAEPCWCQPAGQLTMPQIGCKKTGGFYTRSLFKASRPCCRIAQNEWEQPEPLDPPELPRLAVRTGDDRRRGAASLDHIQPDCAGRKWSRVAFCLTAWLTRLERSARRDRALADRDRDEAQKLVVRHWLFQDGHDPQTSGFALDLRVVDAGYQ